jgi:predicted RecB family nuclease
MKVSKSGKLLLSPTDLTRFYESEFGSWMDHYYESVGVGGPLKKVHRNPPDPLQGLLAEKGNFHEEQVLQKLKEHNEVFTIYRIENEDTAKRIEKTILAMKSGEGFIYQAALSGDTFFGYADLLKRVPGPSILGDFHYEPLDMKIALSPKPTAIIQLCAYADALLKMQGRLPDNMTVITKDGESHTYRTDSFFAFYRGFRNRFVKFHEEFDPMVQPLPLKGDEHRDWSIYAKRTLYERDDIQLTARIRQNHVEKFRAVGINTITGLSKIDSSSKIGDIGEENLSALKNQAELQVRSAAEEKLLYEILPHTKGVRVGLAMLPDSHPKDIFFDMEGYPLLGAQGLEYLYGIAERGDARSKYTEFWAKSMQEESQAFVAFMEYAFNLWKENPGLHIYHYGHYEPSTLKRLMGQYGVCERMMDELLRNEVFVDLYQVVIQGVRVGTYSYGLKAIEKLYYPERETKVSSGAESAIEFSNYLETGDDEFLNRIRAYNQDDCYSTKDLEKFLRQQKDERSISFVPLQKDEVSAREVDPDSIKEQCSRRAQELIEGISIEKRGLPLEDADPADYVQELLAHMLDFHRREDNPDWWEYFRRRDLSADQLFDEVSVLVGVQISTMTDEGDFDCVFDAKQDTKFRAGDEVLILENEAPFEKLKISRWDILRGRLTLSGTPTKIPEGRFTLAPAKSNFKKDALLRALLEEANCFNRGSDHFGLRDSIYDLLLRKPPRIETESNKESLLNPGENTVTGVTRVVSAMNGGCLCIQGPPGTGKTFTGSHVIAALLQQGKNVAISSNSHKAISNLLKKVDEFCKADRSLCRPVKLTSGTRVKAETEEYANSEVPVKSNSTSINVLFGASRKPLHREGPVNLVGATAYYLCKDDLAGRFDYLFVDEATQVCLPNLIAMARCAHNIVLMGDQMQLDQPTKAVHPGDSGSSALVHITAGKSVIDPREGVFLPVTYRMHSKVNSVVSELFYDNELKSDSRTDNQEIIWGKKPSIVLPPNGVQFLPVEHVGNTHGSKEEAEVIKSIVNQALLSKWRDHEGNIHPFTYNDILIVAPYNYQVSLLKEALGAEEARVGSVDLFQGQEAPLVLLSLCASTTKYAPRGISFLLNRNRMNVALSRAQSLAVVVGSPQLANGRTSTVEGMELMNVICRVTEA